MKRFTGYLRACVNPGFSGLARVVIQHHGKSECGPCGGRGFVAHDPTREPCSECGGSGSAYKIETCHCEAGFGVRQLVAVLGDGRQFTKASGEKKARWVVDSTGLLQSVEVVR